MKFATFNWNVRVYDDDGRASIPSYYGYRTKFEAERIASQWREAGYKAEVIKW